MTIKIRTKIILIFGVIALSTSLLNIVVAGLVGQKNFTDDLVNRIALSTKSDVTDITNLVLTKNKGGIVTEIFNTKKSHREVAYLMVLDAEKKIIASTLINQDVEAVFSAHEIPQGQTQEIKLVSIEGEAIYDVAVPLDYGLGVLRVGYYKKGVDASVNKIIYALLIGGFVALSTVLFVGVFLSRKFSGPIEEITETVKKVAGGDLTVRARTEGKDEIGILAENINIMSANLEVFYADIEKRVVERTIELNAKLQELEKLNKFMVNRELKMIELKKEIAELKMLSATDTKTLHVQ
jgi:methyl-accepting chemotaxis protein